MEELKPDAMVLIGDDQKEIFASIVVGFTIYVGNSVEGKKLSGRIREVTGDRARIRVPGHPELAGEILQALGRKNFDVTFFDEPKNKEDGFGHAFLPPLTLLTPALNNPVVPVLVNCYYPPQPSAGRCYNFGRALREILQGTKLVKKVVIGISGGLWHTPGFAEATIDENFDRNLLDTLASGRGGPWRRYRTTNL